MSSVLVPHRPWRAFSLVAAAYLLAALAASVTLWALPELHPMLALGAADLAATLVVFAASRALDNSSVYDAYWSVAPMVAVVWLAAAPGAAREWSGRQCLVVGLVALWGARLTFNWARGWAGLSHEDWRYVEQRSRFPQTYWLVSLVGLHLMPTILVYLGLLPLHAALVRCARPLGMLDVAAALVTLVAIIVEWLADEQLRSFRKTAQPTDICDVGLWRVSRHPNYFGEVAFWVGLALFGAAADAPLWAWSGVVAMIALFVGISIPLAEARSAGSRTGWAEYARRTSRLIPWPPSRR